MAVHTVVRAGFGGHTPVIRLKLDVCSWQSSRFLGLALLLPVTNPAAVFRLYGSVCGGLGFVY